MKFRKKPVVIEAITFDELVEHGRTQVVGEGRALMGDAAMPWSFTYAGHPITHENDECYLIVTLESDSQRMTPQDMLITGVKGEIYPCKKDIFSATYEPATALLEAAPAAQGGESITVTPRELDMAMLIKRLARRLMPGDRLRTLATDFLHNHGLSGSPLRDLSAPSPAVQPAAPTVAEATELLVSALSESKGWLRDYSRAVIEDAIARKEPGAAWQPIETAPKDGARIMLAVFRNGVTRNDSDYYHLATWDGEHCYPYIPNAWTHWMSLPAAPGAEPNTAPSAAAPAQPAKDDADLMRQARKVENYLGDAYDGEPRKVIAALRARLEGQAMTESASLTERTPQDYAIEHAEYMAKDAERLMDALNAEDTLRVRREESDDVEDDDMHDAVCDARRAVAALRSGIYEFRKRRDRAVLSAPAVPMSDARKVLADLVKWKELDDESTRWMPDSHSPTLYAIRDERRQLETAWDRARALLAHPSGSDEALLRITERERKVLRYALFRFARDARAMANEAAQDKKGERHKPRAFEEFTADAEDAEALRARLEGTTK